MRLAVFYFAAGLFLLSVAPAMAQSGRDRALARSLFTEGVELAQQGRHGDAAERFRRAYTLVDAPTVAHNLAMSLSHLGKLVEASELLRVVLRHGDADEGLRELARDTLREVEPRIARLTVQVEGEFGEAQIRLDSEPLVAAALGVPVPVDPGTHQVTAVRGGETVATESVTLGEGQSQSVSIHLPTVEAPAPQDSTQATPSQEPRPIEESSGGLDQTLLSEQSGADQSDAEDEGGGLLSQWWFWTALVAVAAGASVAVIATSGGGVEEPISGTTNPGVLTWR
jgi:hypothetical protein